MVNDLIKKATIKKNNEKEEEEKKVDKWLV